MNERRLRRIIREHETHPWVVQLKRAQVISMEKIHSSTPERAIADSPLSKCAEHPGERWCDCREADSRLEAALERQWLPEQEWEPDEA